MGKVLQSRFDRDGIRECEARRRLDAVDRNAGRSEVRRTDDTAREGIGHAVFERRRIEPLIIFRAVDRLVGDDIREGAALTARDRTAVEQHHQPVLRRDLHAEIHLLHGLLRVALVVIDLDALDAKTADALEFTLNGRFVKK